MHFVKCTLEEYCNLYHVIDIVQIQLSIVVSMPNFVIDFIFISEEHIINTLQIC